MRICDDTRHKPTTAERQTTTQHQQFNRQIPITEYRNKTQQHVHFPKPMIFCCNSHMWMNNRLNIITDIEYTQLNSTTNYCNRPRRLALCLTVPITFTQSSSRNSNRKRNCFPQRIQHHSIQMHTNNHHTQNSIQIPVNFLYRRFHIRYLIATTN